MASTSLREGFYLSEATEEDLESLTTIHTRAFHPGNEFQRHVFPNTPAMRSWWHESFRRGIVDEKSHIFIVKDQNQKNDVVAVIRMRLFDSEEDGAGCWTEMSCTEDHDKDAYAAMLTPMIEKRKEYLWGRPHYLIELFGADNAYQGTGLGKALLGHCCKLADEKGLETFVEANGKASTFYTRFGFVIKDEMLIPGDFNYRECFLVRPPN